MTSMDLVPDRTLVKLHEPYTASENLAADKGHCVLQYYMTIIAYTQQLLDMED